MPPKCHSVTKYYVHMEFIKVLTLILYWFYLWGIGYSYKGENGGQEKT